MSLLFRANVFKGSVQTRHPTLLRMLRRRCFRPALLTFRVWVASAPSTSWPLFRFGANGLTILRRASNLNCCAQAASANVRPAELVTAGTRLDRVDNGSCTIFCAESRVIEKTIAVLCFMAPVVHAALPAVVRRCSLNQMSLSVFRLKSFGRFHAESGSSRLSRLLLLCLIHLVAVPPLFFARSAVNAVGHCDSNRGPDGFYNVPCSLRSCFAGLGLGLGLYTERASNWTGTAL